MTRLLFLATEDWFVASHFLPLIRRAEADGYDVAIAARMSGALAGKTAARLIDLAVDRRSLGLSQLLRERAHVAAALSDFKPDIVHAIALRPVLLALMTPSAGVRRVFAVTGRGTLAVRRTPAARIILGVLARALRGAVNRGDALLVENEADCAWIARGGSLPAARVAQMPGAGVDTDVFAPSPEPGAPVVVGLVARLVRSKGIDLAVEAIARLRREGLAIELRIAGDVDAENREHVPAAEIERWRATPGVSLLGRIDDVAGFWAGAHIACLPSRGGEGLPRVLLEAAACGRPIVTTDVPGCRDFVVAEETGLVAHAGDVDALAASLRRLALDRDLRARLGAAGRARVVEAYSERHAADVAAGLWRRVPER